MADLAFCEAHGQECKAGGLQELYADADFFLERIEGGYPSALNPEVAHIIEAAKRDLGSRPPGLHEEREALRRAYPFREDLTDPETLGYEFPPATPRETPEDWYYPSRTLLHKLTRLAYQEGEGCLVEILEEYRERTAAQLSYAIQDAERKQANSKA